jgi:hypothetical protein
VRWAEARGADDRDREAEAPPDGACAARGVGCRAFDFTAPRDFALDAPADVRDFVGVLRTVAVVLRFAPAPAFVGRFTTAA